MKHLVFYDGQCGLCDRVVKWILKHDTKDVFVFAPLQGSTAQDVLKNLPPEQKKLDTLILIENYGSPESKMYMLGKGAFRICWLLGGVWSALGIFSFLPGWLYNWGYRIVAANRHRLFSVESCTLPSQKDRVKFLP